MASGFFVVGVIVVIEFFGVLLGSLGWFAGGGRSYPLVVWVCFAVRRVPIKRIKFVSFSIGVGKESFFRVIFLHFPFHGARWTASYIRGAKPADGVAVVFVRTERLILMMHLSARNSGTRRWMTRRDGNFVMHIFRDYFGAIQGGMSLAAVHALMQSACFFHVALRKNQAFPNSQHSSKTHNQRPKRQSPRRHHPHRKLINGR